MRTPTLYQFFHHQVHRGFARAGFAEPATVDYVSELLTRFAHTRALYAAAGADGKPLTYVVDFLGAARAAPGHGRTLLRQLGEYTLFMSGLFRERLTARGELGYYLAHGASAYGQCADGEPQPTRRRLFRRLHEDFVRIADTLDEMRRRQFPLDLPPTAGHMAAAFWRA